MKKPDPVYTSRQVKVLETLIGLVEEARKSGLTEVEVRRTIERALNHSRRQK